MKKLLIAFIVCSLFACSNNDTSKETTKDTSSTTTTTTAPVAEAGKCAGYYIFQEGVVIENASFDENGKETSRQVSKVLSVSSSGNKISSEVRMNTTGADSSDAFTGKYSCDGENLYVDISSLFAKMEAKGATIEGGAIVFPINIADGQTLPEAQYTFTMNAEGQQMKTTVHIRDRKVTGNETVTTAAGTFNCYKIAANIDADIDIPGMDEDTKKMMQSMKSKGPKQKMVMYFDPAVSIVRVEMYSNDKLQNRSEIVSIKK